MEELLDGFRHVAPGFFVGSMIDVVLSLVEVVRHYPPYFLSRKWMYDTVVKLLASLKRN